MVKISGLCALWCFGECGEAWALEVFVLVRVWCYFGVGSELFVPIC